MKKPKNQPVTEPKKPEPRKIQLNPLELERLHQLIQARQKATQDLTTFTDTISIAHGERPALVRTDFKDGHLILIDE